MVLGKVSQERRSATLTWRRLTTLARVVGCARSSARFEAADAPLPCAKKYVQRSNGHLFHLRVRI